MLVEKGDEASVHSLFYHFQDASSLSLLPHLVILSTAKVGVRMKSTYPWAQSSVQGGQPLP